MYEVCEVRFNLAGLLNLGVDQWLGRWGPFHLTPSVQSSGRSNASFPNGCQLLKQAGLNTLVFLHAMHNKPMVLAAIICGDGHWLR